MWEWLLSPIDPGRAHEVSVAVSWHARVMVLGWGVLAPLAVLVARFFKVLPRQDWPNELDSTVWWRSHWIGQSLVFVLTAVGLFVILPINWHLMSLHNWMGYGVIALVVLQVGLGIFRGSKGGPTARASDGSTSGHHYDMTPWRRMFEALHKALGYGLLILAMATILLGLWKANGPVWMWASLILWWAALIITFAVLQRRGMAVDTYQAIWGDDPSHPGNRLPYPGWGVRRLSDQDKGGANVRGDRRNRLSSH